MPEARWLSGSEAVLFDLDGTLVDSMWMWPDIDVEYLARFGMTMPPGLQRVIEGMSFSETAVYFKDVLGIPRSLEEIKQDWEDMAFSKYAQEVRLKPYALELLKFLQSKGIKMGIATSNGAAMVDACLDHLSIRSYFQNITTACEVRRGKPFPDIYLHVAEKLGANPSSCLVFEDVPAGIRAGKAAGMRVIAVDDPFSNDVLEEKKRLADAYILSFGELPGVAES